MYILFILRSLHFILLILNTVVFLIPVTLFLNCATSTSEFFKNDFPGETLSLILLTMEIKGSTCILL